MTLLPKYKFMVLDEYLEASEIVDSIDEIPTKFSYIICMAEVEWKYAGYTNGGYTVLGAFNHEYSEVEKIPFNSWAITGIYLNADPHYGYYDRKEVSLSLECINRQLLKNKETFIKTLEKLESTRTKYGKTLFKKKMHIIVNYDEDMFEGYIYLSTVPSSGLKIDIYDFDWYLKNIWFFESLFNEAFNEIFTE